MMPLTLFAKIVTIAVSAVAGACLILDGLREPEIPFEVLVSRERVGYHRMDYRGRMDYSDTDEELNPKYKDSDSHSESYSDFSDEEPESELGMRKHQQQPEPSGWEGDGSFELPHWRERAVSRRNRSTGDASPLWRQRSRRCSV